MFITNSSTWETISAATWRVLQGRLYQSCHHLLLSHASAFVTGISCISFHTTSTNFLFGLPLHPDYPTPHYFSSGDKDGQTSPSGSGISSNVSFSKWTSWITCIKVHRTTCCRPTAYGYQSWLESGEEGQHPHKEIWERGSVIPCDVTFTIGRGR